MATLIYCGAHTGGSLAGLVDAFDRIEAFEAHPGLAAALRTRFAPWRHVRVHQAALAAQDGLQSFQVYGNDAGSGSLAEINPAAVAVVRDFWAADHFDLKGTYEVLTVNLYDWLCRERITHVDLLVTDVQGYDATVLETLLPMLSDGTIQRVQCEVDPDTLPHYLKGPDNSISRVLSIFQRTSGWVQVQGPTSSWDVDADHLQADLVFQRVADGGAQR